MSVGLTLENRKYISKQQRELVAHVRPLSPTRSGPNTLQPVRHIADGGPDAEVTQFQQKSPRLPEAIFRSVESYAG